MLDYYRLLNISRNASIDEIKKAYRSAAFFWHPDKNKSPNAQARFIEMSEAYNILIDSNKRKIYNELLDELKNKSELEVLQHPQNKRKHQEYKVWVAEEKVKGERLAKISIDIILTDSFHFIDKYGWLLMFAGAFLLVMLILTK